MKQIMQQGALALLVGVVTTMPQPAAVAKTAGSQMHQTAKQQVVYTCKMHPEVVSLKPGKCPKCKMTLVKKAVAAVYTCKMHPEVLALKPGKCPKCKMTLTKR